MKKYQFLEFEGGIYEIKKCFDNLAHEAIKIIPGTQLVISTNPQTGAYELNVSPAKVFKAGDQAVESSLSIPNLSISGISTKVPNAPIDN